MEAVEKLETPTTALADDVYADLSNDAYHKLQALSSSGINLLLRSPLHFWDRRINPDGEGEGESDALTEGSAIHTYILEPAQFAARFMLIPDGIDRRTKVGKAAWADLTAQAAAGDMTLLSAEQWERVRQIGEAVMAHPVLSKVFVDGKVEYSILWTDPDTGVQCKARPDYWRTALLVDLKSTEDARADVFRRSVAKYGYHVQAAHYLDGIARATGEQHSNFLHAVVEKSRPFGIGAYVLDDDALKQGRMLCRQARETMARCLDTGEYPGYPAEVQTLGLPAWAMK